MTYRGHITNGRIMLDDAISLPEGAAVNVEFIVPTTTGNDDLTAVLLRHAGKGQNLPPDLAAQHDHYAHGKPKM